MRSLLPARRRLIAVAAALLIASSGCSSDSGGSDNDTAKLTAEEIVRQLVEKVPSARASVVYTADTDPNELLGRPGGYTSKAGFTDVRITDEEPDGRVEAGGSVEVFAKSGQARKRAEYISAVTEGMPMLGPEYDYVAGPVLLRVAQGLTPEEAKEYETALRIIVKS